MNTFLQSLASTLIAGAVLLVGWASFAPEKSEDLSLGGNGGLTAAQCSVTTSSRSIVGNQLSSTVLSAAGNRAWAIIEAPIQATSTIALSFDEGAAAVVGNGLALNSNSTTTKDHIVFGRATEFPYTGAVTGITNVGSTTVTVTECLY